MTETKKTDQEKANGVVIKNRTRRKVVKGLAAGAGALAAYHTFPVNWSTPIIEQIFLPAHAQTSGVSPGGAVSCNIEYLGLVGGLYSLRVTLTANPPEAGVAFSVRVSETSLSGNNDEVWEGTETSAGPIVTGADGTYSTEYSTIEATDFESVEFTATIISTGESSTCSWHGP
jgi:hypothetical protein